MINKKYKIAKMKTNIAICGRPELKEPCNHSAIPLSHPIKIASTAKLIPWNEITLQKPSEPQQFEAPSLGLPRKTRHRFASFASCLRDFSAT